MGKKNNSENYISSKNLTAVEIPADGTLGLLALGAVGIKAWRKKREESIDKKKNNTTNE